MDQRVFAGVGNIYRAEVLFRHNISPFRRGNQLSRNEFDAIWTDLVMLMSQGSKKERIDTVRPEHLPEVMGRLARIDRHGGEVYVYRREGKDCYLCDSAVLMADMTGRKLYWCPTCQSA
jgi:formamidopyrimidine-DNA glycosylase